MTARLSPPPIDLPLDLADPAPRRRRPRLAAIPVVAFVWIGVVVAAAGFVLIAIAWGQVAATLNVGLQMPWLVSAGFTGLGVIIVGLTIVNAAVRHRDGIEHRRQLEAVHEALIEVLAVLNEDDNVRA